MGHWFDVDRLVRATLNTEASDPKLGTVIFHSLKALGRDAFRISDASGFWGRQGANPNTSCIVIDIPGEQREALAGECPSCHGAVQIQSVSEKGIDTGITTYLFETSMGWQSVCLFTRDADFVPPILSLRRQGKQVFVANDQTQTGSGLVRSCQSAFPLDVQFLRRDRATFEFLRQDGGLDQLLQALATAGFEYKASLPNPLFHGSCRGGCVINIKIVGGDRWDQVRAALTVSRTPSWLCHSSSLYTNAAVSSGLSRSLPAG
jgi:uncharacterized LabA/DUF88 family protein